MLQSFYKTEKTAFQIIFWYVNTHSLSVNLAYSKHCLESLMPGFILKPHFR